jgi:hypothetical protein
MFHELQSGGGGGWGTVAFGAFISVVERQTALRLKIQYKNGALYNYRMNCKSAQQFQCIMISSFTHFYFSL